MTDRFWLVPAEASPTGEESIYDAETETLLYTRPVPSCMRHYEENLRHVVRPERPTERETATKVALADYEALYLARLLREYAAYQAPTGEMGIAWAYAEYIDMVIRDEKRPTVVLYAHTQAAYEVLEQATGSVNGGEAALQRSIRKSIDTMRGDLYE